MPLTCFKNVSILEVHDLDFRNFCGWDVISEQLKSLSLKRANVIDPSDLLVAIVLDDLTGHRRRSLSATRVESRESGQVPLVKSESAEQNLHSKNPSQTTNPSTQAGLSRRPFPKGQATCVCQGTSTAPNTCMSSSRGGPSEKSTLNMENPRQTSSLPRTKWRFLRHLSLADNSLTKLPTKSLWVVCSTLTSLDLSSNLFTAVPTCLAQMTALRALNMSNCLLKSLSELHDIPLPHVTVINIRNNRISSANGLSSVASLERLDLRGNQLQEIEDLRDLRGLSRLYELWTSKNACDKAGKDNRLKILRLLTKCNMCSKRFKLNGSGPTAIEDRQLPHSSSSHSTGSVCPCEAQIQTSNPSERASLLKVPDTGVSKRTRGKVSSAATPSGNCEQSSPPSQQAESKRPTEIDRFGGPHKFGRNTSGIRERNLLAPCLPVEMQKHTLWHQLRRDCPDDSRVSDLQLSGHSLQPSIQA